MTSPILDAIYQRRSIREYSDEEVLIDQLREIIKAGTWAPSGLNNQPWRFVTIQDQTIINQMAEQLKNVNTKNKAECTGFLDATTPRADAIVTPAKAKKKKSISVISVIIIQTYR